jgi:hypothetical protein
LKMGRHRQWFYAVLFMTAMLLIVGYWGQGA